MCGIIGYIGPKEVIPILIDGLKRLEYRGYDSAGVAFLTRSNGQDSKNLFIHKKKGKIKDLELSLESLRLTPYDFNFSPSTFNLSPQSFLNVGIGHTRWATHGKPSDKNAHPHSDCSGKIVVVHNGIIENYAQLKKQLISEGHHFSSETDTEVIAHLIEREMNGDIIKAVIRAIKVVEGSYAIGVLSTEDPERIIAARRGSPLILGCSHGENFLASDVPAILPHTKDVIYLEDDEVAIMYSHKIEIFHLRDYEKSKSILPNTSTLIPSPSSQRIHHITWDASMAEKCGYKHFMLKEIYEQPRAVRDTFGRYLDKGKGEINFDEMEINNEELKSIQKIYLIACGTSYHAALIGKLMIEQYAQVPVEVDIASEFRYRSPLFPEKCLTIAISQSGETADTLAAIKQAKENGSKVISICNVVGSSATRESHGVIYTHAGPEIGVASTKAFTTQLIALYLFTIRLASLRGMISDTCRKEMVEGLYLVPEKMETILMRSEEIKGLAFQYHQKKDFLYLGRSFAFPIALEGALKLKEISYIHAEGYPAGEMKHGPIALIDEEMPVVALTPMGRTYDKILSNIEEVKARSGIVIAIASEGDDRIREKADHVFYIPDASEELNTLLMTIPLQLLAYYIADYRGCDIDQPRNLAKSVTVE
jgi:glucosamine--fructose-6-phosphate aminotransferase (isomerizing)